LLNTWQEMGEYATQPPEGSGTVETTRSTEDTVIIYTFILAVAG